MLVVCPSVSLFLTHTHTHTLFDFSIVCIVSASPHTCTLTLSVIIVFFVAFISLCFTCMVCVPLSSSISVCLCVFTALVSRLCGGGGGAASVSVCLLCMSPFLYLRFCTIFSLCVCVLFSHCLNRFAIFSSPPLQLLPRHLACDWWMALYVYVIVSLDNLDKQTAVATKIFF